MASRQRASNRPAPPPALQVERALDPGSDETGASDVEAVVEQVPDERARTSLAARRAALEHVPDRGRAVADGGLAAHARLDDALVVTSDAFLLPAGGTAAELLARRRALIAAQPHGEVTAPAPAATAATGQRELQVQCRQAGRHILELRYEHAFDPDAPVAATWELTVDIAPRLAERQRQRLLDVDVDARLPGDPDDDALFG